MCFVNSEEQCPHACIFRSVISDLLDLRDSFTCFSFPFKISVELSFRLKTGSEQIAKCWHLK